MASLGPVRPETRVVRANAQIGVDFSDPEWAFSSDTRVFENVLRGFQAADVMTNTRLFEQINFENADELHADTKFYRHRGHTPSSWPVNIHDVFKSSTMTVGDVFAFIYASAILTKPTFVAPDADVPAASTSLVSFDEPIFWIQQRYTDREWNSGDPALQGLYDDNGFVGGHPFINATPSRHERARRRVVYHDTHSDQMFVQRGSLLYGLPPGPSSMDVLVLAKMMTVLHEDVYDSAVAMNLVNLSDFEDFVFATTIRRTQRSPASVFEDTDVSAWHRDYAYANTSDHTYGLFIAFTFIADDAERVETRKCATQVLSRTKNHANKRGVVHAGRYVSKLSLGTYPANAPNSSDELPTFYTQYAPNLTMLHRGPPGNYAEAFSSFMEACPEASTKSGVLVRTMMYLQRSS